MIKEIKNTNEWSIEWGAWNMCSGNCGNQTRIRRRLVSDKLEEETETCISKDCESVLNKGKIKNLTLIYKLNQSVLKFFNYFLKIYWMKVLFAEELTT